MAQDDIRIEEIELDDGTIKDVSGGKSVLKVLEELSDSELLRELFNAVVADNKARLVKIRVLLQERGLQKKAEEYIRKASVRNSPKGSTVKNNKNNNKCSV